MSLWRPHSPLPTHGCPGPLWCPQTQSPTACHCSKPCLMASSHPALCPCLPIASGPRLVLLWPFASCCFLGLGRAALHPHSCARATLRALISCHSCPAQLTVTVLVFWLMSFKSGSRPASELLPGVRWGSGGCPGQRGRCPRSVLGLWVGLKREQFSLACWPCACTVWRGCHLS